MPRYFNALIAALSVEQRERIEKVTIDYVYEEDRGRVEREGLGYPALGALGGLKRVVLRDMSCMSKVEETVARHEFRRVSQKEIEIVKIC
jgi:hypothetical protein